MPRPRLSVQCLALAALLSVNAPVARAASVAALISPLGPGGGASLGLAVSAVGDVNQDGSPDLVAGSNLDAVYIYYGGVDADDQVDLVLHGPTAFSGFGFAVAIAGDVNHDGADDIVVGALESNIGTGHAYIYYGGATMDASPDLILSGEALDDFFGISVAGAGDVNGDGYGDVIVGAERNDAGGTNAGRAYIYYGGPGNDGQAVAYPAPDIVLTGRGLAYGFGGSVSGAGDVNGDGFADVIVGARGAPPSSNGRAYVFYGGMGDVSEDVVFIGEHSNDFLGTAVSGAGDVNRDGYDDVIVGAPNNDESGVDAGRAYVYYGAAASDGGPLLVRAPALTLTGEAANDQFGWAVSGAGDLDRDGYADVLVGAYGNNAGGADAGRAYAYYGGNPPDAVADFTVTGEAAGNRLGWAVSPAGDFNGDGYGDFAAAAIWFDSGALLAVGRAYVFGVYPGPAQAPVLDPIAVMTAAAGVSVTFTDAVHATDADLGTISLTLSSFAPISVDLVGGTGGPGRTRADIRISSTTTQGGTYLGSCEASDGTFVAVQPVTVVIQAPSLSPDVLCPGSVAGAENVAVSFVVSATDPNGDEVTLRLESITPAVLGPTFFDNHDGTGSFSWLPTYGDAGSYSVKFTGTDPGGLSTSCFTQIGIVNTNRSPQCNVNGPYTRCQGVGISFTSAGSADPDGDPLAYLWNFGDGATSADPNPVHTYSTDGSFGVTLSVTDGKGGASLCRTTATITAAAEASLWSKDRTIRPGSGGAKACFQIEPVAGSFDLGSVVLSSVTLSYNSKTAPAISGKVSVGDRNRNGIPDLEVCFSKSDLKKVFAGLPTGHNVLTIEIGGLLGAGCSFAGTAVVDIFSDGSFLAPAVYPNPLNPGATLSFHTSSPGAVRIQMFDVHGRLIRSILDVQDLDAGDHHVSLDGLDGRGVRLATGVYYIRIGQEGSGELKVPLVILK